MLKIFTKTILTKKINQFIEPFTTITQLNKSLQRHCSSNNDGRNQFKSSIFPAAISSEQTSLTAIKRAIKSATVESADGFVFISTKCPICSHNNGENKAIEQNIFINKTTGNIVCPSCQLVCNWSTMEPFFDRKITKNMEKYKELFVKNKQSIEKTNLPKNAQRMSELTKEEFTDLLTHLELAEFPAAIFESLNVLCDKANRILYFPLLNINGDAVGYRQLRPFNNSIAEQTVPETNCYGLIITKPLSVQQQKTQKELTSAILVLTIKDLLALSVQKINSSIICLPHGFKSLPQECLPGLEKFQKLILWFNYDTIGWDAALTFAKKLDEKRCLFVRPTELHPTPYKAMQQSIDIKTILTKAQPILHKAITTFHSLRQDVLSELQNIDKVHGVKWHRYPVLNKYLKGHRKGELTILTGPTGCGKTTFMSEYSLDLAMQGVTTLWGSFEIRNTRLASTLLRQLAGHPLDENLNDFDLYADKFESLPMYFMTFHGQQTIKVVMETIEHAQYVHDIHHVIIDNVQFMMGTGDESKHMDRFWKQDTIIAAFRTFATKSNCHVTLVIHPRKERDVEELTTSSIFGSAKATQEADNVLIIQDKRLTAIRGKKYLQIAKNRFSGDLGVMPLDFDKLGLSYAPKKTVKKSTDEAPAVDKPPNYLDMLDNKTVTSSS